MKIKDAKKPCKTGTGTLGLKRRPWERRAERPALSSRLVTGARRGRKGGRVGGRERCHPRLRAADFPTPMLAGRASAAPHPAAPTCSWTGGLGGTRENFYSGSPRRERRVSHDCQLGVGNSHPFFSSFF